jgi:hypothetical protein
MVRDSLADGLKIFSCRCFQSPLMIDLSGKASTGRGNHPRSNMARTLAQARAGDKIFYRSGRSLFRARDEEKPGALHLRAR